jgi:uncharacterized membrane protein
MTVAAALMLAACTQPAPAPKAHGAPSEGQPESVSAPASGPSIGGIDLASDLKLAGDAPAAWTLDIGAEQLKLVRAGKPDMVARNAGPQLSGDSAVWSANAADGAPLTVTVRAAPCYAGGKPMPLSAVVDTGVMTLKGCATGAPAAASAAAAPATPNGQAVDVE